MSRAVVLCAVLGACADVPTPVAFAGLSLVVTTDGDGTHVKSDVFEIDFPATGVLLPTHLLDATGQELLGSNPACAAESLVGVSVTPALTVAGGSSATSSKLTVVEAGPGVVKIRVTYAATYPCPSATSLSGSTDFTIVPSGRIVREDSVQPTAEVLSPSASCGCATSQQNFAFSTFYTFAGAGASQVQTDGTPIADDVFQSCSMYSNHGIAVSFAQLTDTHTRYHAGATAAHVLDWYANATTLPTDQKPMTSAIQIGAGATCQQLQAFLADAPISIGDTQLDSTDHDGIYRDNLAVHTSAFDIKPQPGKPNIPPGFAISVDLGGADHATITRSDGLEGTIGVPQREDGSRYLIFFPGGLAAGETITITPQ